jgi:hypothetical protein
VVQQARFPGGSGVVEAKASEFGNTIGSLAGCLWRGQSSVANDLVVLGMGRGNGSLGGHRNVASSGYTERARDLEQHGASYMPTLALDTANALTTGTQLRRATGRGAPRLTSARLSRTTRLLASGISHDLAY